MNRFRTGIFMIAVAFGLSGSGCQQQDGGYVQGPTQKAESSGVGEKNHATEIESARSQLSAEDRKLADEQEYCVVMQDTHLGEMGPPLKLTVGDKTVFVCCKGCQKRALADADKTLAALATVKAKAKAEKK